MKDLIIFGAGKFAEVAHYYFTRDSEYKVVGFCIDEAQGGSFCNLPLVPFQGVEGVFPPAQCDIFVAIGYKNLNRARASKCDEAESKGYTLASYVSSKLSRLEPPKMGKHCFIFEDNTIQPFTSIGDNVIIWSGNHIGHHTAIGSHVFVSSHVCIGGNSKVGDRCFFGMNSTVRDGVAVASDCIVGVGAYIHKDTEPNRVYSISGTPAREGLSADKLEL